MTRQQFHLTNIIRKQLVVFMKNLANQDNSNFDWHSISLSDYFFASIFRRDNLSWNVKLFKRRIIKFHSELSSKFGQSRKCPEFPLIEMWNWCFLSNEIVKKSHNIRIHQKMRLIIPWSWNTVIDFYIFRKIYNFLLINNEHQEWRTEGTILI